MRLHICTDDDRQCEVTAFVSAQRGSIFEQPAVMDVGFCQQNHESQAARLHVRDQARGQLAQQRQQVAGRQGT